MEKRDTSSLIANALFLFLTRRKAAIGLCAAGAVLVLFATALGSNITEAHSTFLRDAPSSEVAPSALFQNYVVDVWTDQSVYQVGDTITIYYSVNASATSGTITITKPDDSTVDLDLGSISAGTHYRSGTAGEPLGMRTVEFEACGIGGAFLCLSDTTTFEVTGQDVTFTGKLTNIESLIGGTTWTVQVHEVQSGPPLDSVVDAWYAVHPDCTGAELDLSLQVGDTVEVRGVYQSRSSVKICGAGYYIRKKRDCATHHFLGEVIPRTDGLDPIAYGYIVRVTEVLAETPDFDINVGDEVIVSAEEDAIRTQPPNPGDMVEVLGHFSFVSCGPACDAVGIRVEVVCYEYIAPVTSPPDFISGSISWEETCSPGVYTWKLTECDSGQQYWLGWDGIDQDIPPGTWGVRIYDPVLVSNWCNGSPRVSSFFTIEQISSCSDPIQCGWIASLRGTVLDTRTNEPLSGVEINISGGDGNAPIREQTFTNAGVYAFDNLPAGTYWLEASAEGYEKFGTHVTVADNECNIYNFRMGPPRSYEDLAAYYSPVWYQKTAEDDFDADYITKFDFDGNWTGNDNWWNQNHGDHPLKAYVYYAVVETESHWFITYADFHPRDWGLWDLTSCLSDDGTKPGIPLIEDRCHENDMEGVLVAVKKDGSTYGQFHLMETMWHKDFHRYSNDSGIERGTQGIDGHVQFWGHTHPEVSVEYRGHGVSAYHDDGFANGVIYVLEAGNAEEPPPGYPSTPPVVKYDLIPIKDTLWKHRLDFRADDGDGQTTYAAWGVFDGDDYGDDKAHAPWAWDDHNDGPVRTGDIFLSPAHAVSTHLNGLGDDFSYEYISNPYREQEAVASPSAGGSLSSTDGSTQLRLPPGAMSDTIVMSHSPQSDLPPTGGLANIGHSFELSATVMATGAPVTGFRKPYELTIEYTDDEIQFVEEGSLGLYWWNGSAWVVEQTGAVDINSNTVTATPNHMTTFAVLGTPKPLACYDFDPPSGVKVDDIQAIANSWRLAAGPPYDLDGDGWVTVKDIMEQAAHWGETCVVTEEVIVDDLDPGFQRFGPSGDWRDPVPNENNDMYNAHAYWAYGASQWYGETINNWATWHPNLPVNGQYQVSVFVPWVDTGHNDTSRARYETHSAEGDFVVEVDQSTNQGSWVDLGTWQFNAGTEGYVELKDVTPDYQNKTIKFDAVRFVRVSATR